MVSQEVREKANSLIELIAEKYVKVEKVPYEKISYIYDKYVTQIFSLEEDSKKELLDLIEKSYKSNKTHGKIRQWGRLCLGILEILNGEEDYIDQSKAADVIVRLSRWYHSEGGFYLEFIPWAKKIANHIWGGIPVLY